jgi:hypothetical protein
MEVRLKRFQQALTVWQMVVLLNGLKLKSGTRHHPIIVSGAALNDKK